MFQLPDPEIPILEFDQPVILRLRRTIVEGTFYFCPIYSPILIKEKNAIPTFQRDFGAKIRRLYCESRAKAPTGPVARMNLLMTSLMGWKGPEEEVAALLPNPHSKQQQTRKHPGNTDQSSIGNGRVNNIQITRWKINIMDIYKRKTSGKLKRKRFFRKKKVKIKSRIPKSTIFPPAVIIAVPSDPRKRKKELAAMKVRKGTK